MTIGHALAAAHWAQFTALRQQPLMFMAPVQKIEQADNLLHSEQLCALGDAGYPGIQKRDQHAHHQHALAAISDLLMRKI